MNKISIYILLATFVWMFSSCEEKLDSTSIFSIETPEMNEFDIWLREQFTDNYNIDFKYRMEDIESDMTYNLVPATYENSIKLAKLTKYLWLEAYDELTGSMEFMQTYTPRVLHLIGSPAYKPSSNSIVLGTAEGGVKITLYNVNNLDPTNVEFLNFWYFKTMHHEFAHILHQTKNYTTDFNLLSAGSYQGENWVNVSDAEALQMGFITDYASGYPDEDFVEVIANYVTHNEVYWQQQMAIAGATGSSILQAKLDIVKDYLLNSWGIDLDKLRDIVQRRSGDFTQKLDLDNL